MSSVLFHFKQLTSVIILLLWKECFSSYDYTRLSSVTLSCAIMEEGNGERELPGGWENPQRRLSTISQVHLGLRVKKMGHLQPPSAREETRLQLTLKSGRWGTGMTYQEFSHEIYSFLFHIKKKNIYICLIYLEIIEYLWTNFLKYQNKCLVMVHFVRERINLKY